MSDNNRFARQERLPQVGLDGQKLLQGATVAIIGVGALGCTSAEWLCRAGVGKLILIDRDIVNQSNLQRQCLFDERDAESRSPKAVAAQQRLAKINSECEIEAHCVDLGAHNIHEICSAADVIVDGCDNFFTRYLINDFSVKHKIAYVYAGAVATYGMLALLDGSNACLRCVFPEPAPIDDTPTCSSSGILGPTIGVIGSAAAALAIQSICNAELPQKFVSIEMWPFNSQSINAAKNKDCPCCAKRQLEWLDQQRCAPLITQNCNQTEVHFSGNGTIDLMQLGDKFKGALNDLSYSNFCLQFTDNNYEIFVFSDRSIHVYNCSSIADAKAVIANTVGL
ncbi:MAG: ThiF family adenylyltransferase [Planctomycetes bacterium]|nr:ThiF family adenylyltransferase [Planctomycetota bacterium]